MVATLARSGSSFTLGNEQSYDVWGSVRSGSSSEDQGYVANLGHRADPESFLTYMRARYYEPMSGRFISEDLAAYGDNWFSYSSNRPTTLIDFAGYEPWFVSPTAALEYIQNIIKWALNASESVKGCGDAGRIVRTVDRLRRHIDKLRSMSRALGVMAQVEVDAGAGGSFVGPGKGDWMNIEFGRGLTWKLAQSLALEAIKLLEYIVGYLLEG